MPENHPTDWLNSHGDATPVIDPARRMRALAARAGVEEYPLFPRLALCAFMDRTVEALTAATKASPCSFHPRAAVGELDGQPVAVGRLRPGAPGAVQHLEEIIGGGVRTLLVGGAVGSLLPHVTIGDYVVPTSALREEGTSLHYVPSDHEPRADGAAVQALIRAAGQSGRKVHVGRVWSTDAPYRELAGKVRAYGDQGLLGVEMETSALMSVADFRGVDVGVLLTVSDHVFDSEWPNIFGSPEFKGNCADLAQVLLSAARHELDHGDEAGS